jgi:hypothetical protein
MTTFTLIVISIWTVYGLALWSFVPISGDFPAELFPVVIWATVFAVVAWLAGYRLACSFRRRA